MNRFIFLLLCFVFISTRSMGQEISESQTSFVNEFLTEVVEHNNKAVLKKLDKHYRKEQLKILDGNKQQLIDELFSGNDISSDQFGTLKLDEIIRIEVAEVIDIDGTSYEYIFRVRSSDKDLLCPLVLRINKKKFGFVGAVG